MPKLGLTVLPTLTILWFGLTIRQKINRLRRNPNLVIPNPIQEAYKRRRAEAPTGLVPIEPDPGAEEAPPKPGDDEPR